MTLKREFGHKDKYEVEFTAPEIRLSDDQLKLMLAIIAADEDKLCQLKLFLGGDQ